MTIDQTAWTIIGTIWAWLLLADLCRRIDNWTASRRRARQRIDARLYRWF